MDPFRFQKCCVKTQSCVHVYHCRCCENENVAMFSGPLSSTRRWSTIVQNNSNNNKHTVAMRVDKLWLDRRRVSRVWWEQRMLDSYHKQHTVRWWRQSVCHVSDSVSCLMRTAHARFLSQTTYCPMVTSVCLSYVSDNVSCLMRTALVSILLDTAHWGPMVRSKSVGVLIQ